MILYRDTPCAKRPNAVGPRPLPMDSDAQTSMASTMDAPSPLELFQLLLARYGPQQWWPAETALEVVVGAILTQATSWRNVVRALAQLRAAGLLNEEALLAAPESVLAEHIRSAGFFRVKARRLRAFFDAVLAHAGGDLHRFLAQEPEALRRQLLAIPGIGPETADSILLYAAGAPFFVVDSYTERIMGRLGWWETSPVSYQERQAWFQGRLPRDPALFNEFHALLVQHAKEACRRTPRCAACCLMQRCAYGRRVTVARAR
jgi:endonuclease-3 related protein